MTTLVREYLLGVATILQDINPQWRRWGEIELVRYGNFGIRALAKYLPQVGSAIDTIQLRPGTHQNLRTVLTADIVPGDGSAARDTAGLAFLGVVCNMGTGATPGRVPRVVDAETLDVSSPTWHQETADTAIKEVVFDKMHPLDFFVRPPVHGSTEVWAKVKWLRMPKAITAGGVPGVERYKLTGAGENDLLDIPDLNVEDLTNYTVAMALMKGSKNVVNLPKANTHAQLFIASINSQAQLYTGVSPNLKTLPFAAEVPGAA